jgi:hypothetical protein
VATLKEFEEALREQGMQMALAIWSACASVTAPGARWRPPGGWRGAR